MDTPINLIGERDLAKQVALHPSGEVALVNALCWKLRGYRVPLLGCFRMSIGHETLQVLGELI
jgi:hypothetical protein